MKAWNKSAVLLRRLERMGMGDIRRVADRFREKGLLVDAAPRIDGRTREARKGRA